MRHMACPSVVLSPFVLRAVRALKQAVWKRLSVIWEATVLLNSCQAGEGCEAEYYSRSKRVSWNRSPDPLIINAKLQSNFPRMPHLPSL